MTENKPLNPKMGWGGVPKSKRLRRIAKAARRKKRQRQPLPPPLLFRNCRFKIAAFSFVFRSLCAV